MDEGEPARAPPLVSVRQLRPFQSAAPALPVSQQSGLPQNMFAFFCRSAYPRDDSRNYEARSAVFGQIIFNYALVANACVRLLAGVRFHTTTKCRKMNGRGIAACASNVLFLPGGPVLPCAQARGIKLKTRRRIRADMTGTPAAGICTTPGPCLSTIR